MKKIRTKKMMILLIIITILLGTAYMLYDNIVYAVGIVYEKVKGTDKADDYYNKIANELSDRDGGLRAANRRIENILKKDTSTNLLIDKVNISYMGLTTCNFKLDIEKLKGINEEYNKIKNVYKKDDLLARYEIGVSLMNWLGGKSDKAIYILENIDYIEEELNDIRKLNLAIMYINSNRIKEGQQIIKKDINKNDKYKYIREGIIQYVKFIEGNFDDFSYSKEYNYNYKPKIEDPYVVHLDNMDSVLRNIKNFLDMRDKHENYKNEVTGNISYKGKGMSNIIVYLKEEEYKSSCSFGEYNLVNDYIKALAVTDSDGNYTIKNIPDGNYIIGVLLDWHKVKDKKIEFKGEPIMIINNNKKLKCDIEMIDGIKIANVEKLDKNKFEINWKDDRGDISYYSLNLEKEGVNYYVADNIKTKSTIIDLNKQLKDGDILISGMTSNSLGVNPYFILPPLYFSGDYKVQVNGYNREGDIITDSRGTFNNEEVYINIEGKELTKADKYLVERDYEKAIELYDKSLKEDPKDIHSAKILAKLYKKGWKYDREDGGRSLKGRDYKKAKEYLKIVEGNNGLDKQLIGMFGDIEFDLGNYDKAIELYKGLVEDTSYYYRYIGDVYLCKNDYSSGLKYYEKYYEMESSNIEDLVMMYILTNDTDKLEKILKDEKPTVYHLGYKENINKYIKMDKREYKEFYKSINNNKIENAKSYLKSKDNDLAKLYKGIFILQSDNDRNKRKEEYKKLYKSVTNKTIKDLMMKLGRDNINSGFGDGFD